MTVNAYVIEGRPLMLVDGGPSWLSSLDSLEFDLASLGFGIADVEFIVLTHHHSDHAGLAEHITRRSGAVLATVDALVEHFADVTASAEQELEYISDLLTHCGVPRCLVAAVLPSMVLGQRLTCASVAVTRPLRAGDWIEQDTHRWQVLSRPGHSQVDIVLWDADSGVLISGDHLLTHGRAVTHLGMPIHGEAGLSLSTYQASLSATRALGASIALPGHGPVIENPSELIDQRLSELAARAKSVHRLLQSAGPCTPWELASAVFGETGPVKLIPRMGELLGYLGLLAETGRATYDADAEGDTLVCATA